MGHDAMKLELIEWLAKLEDADTIEYLKLVKDSASSESDWWDDLVPAQKKSIKRGLKDIDEGRITSHEQVIKKYGL
jgi:hypothetical protein